MKLLSAGAPSPHKKKVPTRCRDFKFSVSIRKEKQRKDSEVKPHAGVSCYRRVVCVDLLHKGHTRCRPMRIVLLAPPNVEEYYTASLLVRGLKASVI
jgi:hypothetical protein